MCRLVFIQEDQKVSTVSRLCGVYGRTGAESSTGKSFPMAYATGGMTMMKTNSGGFQTKMTNGSSTLRMTYLAQLD